MLRTHIQRKSDGADDSDDVQHIATRDDDYDPMDDIGSKAVTGRAGGEKAILATDNKGRTRYYRNRFENCIVTVNLPSRCP